MESSVVGRDATIAEVKALENPIDNGRPPWPSCAAWASSVCGQ